MAFDECNSDDPGRGIRPVRARWIVGTMVLIVACLEISLALFYPKGTLYARATAYRDGPRDPRDVLVMGTCQVNRILDLKKLQEQLGDDVKVHDLSSPATCPLDWYLVASNFVRENANISMIVLPYAPGDLTMFAFPWESQIMDLARWQNMPHILKLTCRTSACVFDMGMRKLSLIYRYRGFIAKRLWSKLGSREREISPQLPGGIPHPERQGNFHPCADAPGTGLEATGAVDGDYELEVWRAGPWAVEADTDVVRAPDVRERFRNAFWGTADFDSISEIERNPLGYLEAFLELVKTRGYKIVMIPMPYFKGAEERGPERAAGTSGRALPGKDAGATMDANEILDRLEWPNLIRAPGPGLVPQDILEEGLTPEGSQGVTRHVAEVIRNQLDTHPSQR